MRYEFNPMGDGPIRLSRNTRELAKRYLQGDYAGRLVYAGNLIDGITGWPEMDNQTRHAKLAEKLSAAALLEIVPDELLAAAGARIQVRCPVIPGCNDAPTELAAVQRIAAGFGLGEVEFLPFNPAAAAQYDGLARSYSAESGAVASRTAEPSGAELTGPLSSPKRTEGSSVTPE